MKEQAEMKAVVTFSVGHYRFCISAHVVKALITAPKMRKLPVNGEGVEGVFNYQGKIVTAVSLRRKFGLPDTSNESDIWIISCVDSVPVAFHVDTVMDVISVNDIEWRRVEALPVNWIDRFALYEKNIFLFTSFEPLLAMRDMSKRNEGMGRMCPVEIEATKPDSSTTIDAANSDNITEARTLHPDPTESPKDIPEPACSDTNETKDHSLIETRRNNDASDGPLTSSPRKNRFATDSRPAFQEPRKQENHLSIAASMENCRHTAINKLPTQLISPDDSRHDIIGVCRGFGWKPVLAIAAVVILLSVYTLFHFGATGKNLASTASLTIKEEPVFTGRSFDSDATAGGSPQKRLCDERPEKPARTSEISPETGRTEQSDPQETSSMESAKDAKRVGTMPLNKTESAYDDGKNIIPDQPHETFEVMRIATKQYTVTVERSSAVPGPTESQTEGVAPVISHNQITHIVVKGDTLWDVSEQHLNDPFRYPELAELSNISDPHWIYPGDIIRIIKNEPEQVR